METPETDDLIIVGRIVKAHGIRGELKVLPETDDPDLLLDIESIRVGEHAGHTIRLTLEHVRFQPSKKGLVALVSFKEIKTRDDAETLVKSFLYIPESDLKLDDDEFLLHDLIGCAVWDAEKGNIGSVKDVLEMPAQMVYLVERSGQPDVMIPAVDAFIEDIDLEARRIVIHAVDGLLDD